MVLAIIADTHLPRGRRRLPPACVARLRGADHILHAGDVSSAAVLADLRLGPPVTAVHGNVDDEILRRELPAQIELQLGAVRVAMVHNGGPAQRRAARLRARFLTAHAVVFGHSHIPLLHHEDGLTIFNPGSPTDRRRQAQHTMGIAHIRGSRIEFEHVGLGR